MKNLKNIIVTATFGIMTLTAAFVLRPTSVLAAAPDYQQAKISFTFDDGFESLYQYGLPILHSAGYEATLYYITGIGDGTFQGGKTDDGKPAITWDQVKSLQNNYGWEIGSHTVNHILLSQATPAQLTTELTQSKAELEAHGITPVSTFAFPEGDYNTSTLVQTAKYYQASRGFQDLGLETFPYNKIVITDESLDSFMTLASAEAMVDQAIANKQWLVFTGHGIQPATDPNYAYIWTTANFQALVNYIKSKNVPVEKIGDVVTAPGPNLTKNSSFEDTFTNGWTTDDAAHVTVDTANNGSYPSPTNSVKVTGSTIASHVFSTLLHVIPGGDYLLDAFVNTTNMTAGEFGFYIDEYDAAGNWLTGQWLGQVVKNTVGFFDKIYHTTSALVDSLRVQTYTTTATTGFIYTDNVNLYDLTASPSAMPKQTPNISSDMNYIVNPGFETLTSSTSAESWTADTKNWTFDTNSKGNEGSNSAQLNANSTVNHLFSALTTIPNDITYTWNTFVSTTNLSGEFGFYIDEYDAAGTWLSGQWKGAITAAYNGFKTFIYTPTNNLVQQVRLQYYNSATTTGNVTLDSISLNPNVSPTPTSDPTPTATPSGTPTPSVSPTPTPETSNIVLNPSFETVTGTFADDWTNDNGAAWTIDTHSKGNDASNSAQLVTNGTSTHMYSMTYAIDASQNYTWTSFVTTSNVTGEFGFYIDEYDALGNWISGQWKGMIHAAFTGFKTFVYVPTNNLVKAIRLQYYNTAASTGSVNVDSVSLISNSTPTPSVSPTPTATPSSTPTPTVTPTVTPTPTPSVNLVTDGSFESGSFSPAWTNDNTVDWTIDTSSNGNDGSHSAKLIANSTANHLFTTLFPIDSTKTFSWTSYVKSLDFAGEFGFYIDEYDAAGIWLSGQWKSMINGPTTNTITIPYTPTSTNVKQVRLQYYNTAASAGTLYLDSVSFTQN